MATQPDYRAEFNPIMTEGDTFGKYRFYFKTSDTPTYESFAGCTFLADLIRDGASVIESTTANSRMGLVTGAEATAMGLDDNEAFYWVIDANDAAVLTVGKYKFDIKVTYVDGTVRTRWFGTLTVNAKRSE